MPEKEKQPEKTEEGTMGQDVSSPLEGNKKSIDDIMNKVKNIERVLDVNVEVRVEIGELKVKLKEVLDLQNGSIIELEKSVENALFDLQVGEKVVAQGEVVTVGENLGIRIVKK
ncbi:MAG: FliM/FliN family flagellar motor switch protein [Candidatus Omnitrophica bacterium]|nr:FliM/FliN family flagellar motor switch protein [Candidatus Omnitrophota bacterium]